MLFLIYMNVAWALSTLMMSSNFQFSIFGPLNDGKQGKLGKIAKIIISNFAIFSIFPYPHAMEKSRYRYR